MKRKKLLKISLFSLICAMLFAIAGNMTHVEPVYILAVIAAVICVGTAIVYGCSLIFHKFRYSVNVIVIVVFSCIAVIAYILEPNDTYISSIEEFLNASIINMTRIGATLAAVVSIMVLIGRMIFKDRESEEKVEFDKEENYPEIINDETIEK